MDIFKLDRFCLPEKECRRVGSYQMAARSHQMIQANAKGLWKCSTKVVEETGFGNSNGGARLVSALSGFIVDSSPTFAHRSCAVQNSKRASKIPNPS